MTSTKPINAQIAALEKKLGTGATYSRAEQTLILEGAVPEWLLRARVMLTGDDKAWAEKLIEGLKKARQQLWPKVRFSETETTPPPAERQPGDH